MTQEQYCCMTCGRTDSPEWRKVCTSQNCYACLLPFMSTVRVPKVRRLFAMHAAYAGRRPFARDPPSLKAKGNDGRSAHLLHTGRYCRKQSNEVSTQTMFSHLVSIRLYGLSCPFLVFLLSLSQCAWSYCLQTLFCTVRNLEFESSFPYFNILHMQQMVYTALGQSDV